MHFSSLRHLSAPPPPKNNTHIYVYKQKRLHIKHLRTTRGMKLSSPVSSSKLKSPSVSLTCWSSRRSSCWSSTSSWKPHTQRASQDTFAAELQVEREKNRVLQKELKGIRVLDCDIEVQNWTLSEQADPLHRKLQQEVRQGTLHQEDQEKLLVANKHSLEVRANRETNEFFQSGVRGDQRSSAKLPNKGEVFCIGKKTVAVKAQWTAHCQAFQMCSEELDNSTNTSLISSPMLVTPPTIGCHPAF